MENRLCDIASQGRIEMAGLLKARVGKIKIGIPKSGRWL